MSETDLPSQVYEIVTKFNTLTDEIEYHRQQNETKQAEDKTNKLKQLVIQHLKPNEKELRIFDSVAKESSDIITDYLVNTMVSRLNNTNFFSKIEETVYTAAQFLTKEPYNIGQEAAINVVKFGFLIEAYKHINIPSSIETWRKSLSDYLEKDLNISQAKVNNLIKVADTIAATLVKVYLPEVEGTFYINKIANELPLNPENFTEQPVAEIATQHQKIIDGSDQLLKYAQNISTLKQQNEASKLKIAWEKFNKCLGQDLGASPKEVREIGSALDTNIPLFEEKLLAFFAKKFEDAEPEIRFYQ